ncbi:MAG: hypothetical protein LBU09_02315 [Endomicrobium sp.]|jgi:hypothetical protein|nr:hypothetical protein [Endomicrobium sp.]
MKKIIVFALSIFLFYSLSACGKTETINKIVGTSCECSNNESGNNEGGNNEPQQKTVEELHAELLSLINVIESYKESINTLLNLYPEDVSYIYIYSLRGRLTFIRDYRGIDAYINFKKNLYTDIILLNREIEDHRYSIAEAKQVFNILAEYYGDSARL